MTSANEPKVPFEPVTHLTRPATAPQSGELWVALAHGANPDLPGGYHNGRPAVTSRRNVVKCASLAEASRLCRAYIERHDLGSGNWRGGDITDASGRLVARVSFYGRVWDDNGLSMEVS
jgi:hypothetical protein